MPEWRTITSVVRTPCVSCSSIAAALCVLRLQYTSQKTQANRKENEHVENSLQQPCDLVFRTAVLRCSILHREAAARNPEICRRGQVHGCRKADVTQALRSVILCEIACDLPHGLYVLSLAAKTHEQTVVRLM